MFEAVVGLGISALVIVGLFYGVYRLVDKLAGPSDPEFPASSLKPTEDPESALTESEPSPPIRVVCACGKAMKVDARLEGGSFRCPRCGDSVVIPVHGLDPLPSPSYAARPVSPKEGHGALFWIGRLALYFLVLPALAIGLVVGFLFREQAVEKAGQGIAVVRQKVAEASQPVVKGDVSGGAWLTRKAGSSEVLRGLSVSLIPAKVRKGDLGELFEKMENVCLALQREQERLAGTGASGEQLRHARHAAQYGLIAAVVARDAELRDDELVETKFLLGTLRLMSCGDPEAATNAEIFDAIHDNPAVPETASRLRVASATTDIEGKYRIPAVPQGDYLVYALFRTDFALAEWFIPVKVERSAAVVVNLFNESADQILNKRD